MKNSEVFGSNFTYYHCSGEENVASIQKLGLKWDVECKRRIGEHQPLFFGNGVYIARDYREALTWGNSLFRITVSEGTRILDISQPPDQKILKVIKRKYGKDALTKEPWKAIPFNKEWTQEELIALTRNHYRRAKKGTKKGIRYKKPFYKYDLLWQMVRKLKGLLVRFGFHGYGETKSNCGLVIFDSDRVRVSYVGLLPEYFRHCDFSQVSEDAVHRIMSLGSNPVQQAQLAIAEGLLPLGYFSNIENFIDPKFSNLRKVARDFPWLLKNPMWRDLHSKLNKRCELEIFEFKKWLYEDFLNEIAGRSKYSGKNAPPVFS